MNFFVDKSLPTFLIISLDKIVVGILVILHVYLMASYVFGYLAFKKDCTKERLCQFTWPLVVLESATLPHREVTLKREIRPDIDLIEESSTIDSNRFAV